MSGLFDGTPLERPITCELCKRPLADCACPRSESGVVLLPKGQPVRVGREKRRKGKTVTIITGLDHVAVRDNLLSAMGGMVGFSVAATFHGEGKRNISDGTAVGF